MSSEQPTSTGGVGGSEGPGGHAEGEWLPDASGGHQYRYYVHGQPTDFVSDSGVASMDEHAEWRVDPAGRHQYRYFVRGQATQAVSDSGVQSTDPLPLAPAGDAAPAYVSAPASPRGGGPPVWVWAGLGGLIVILVVLIVAVMSTRSDNSSESGPVSSTTASPSPDAGSSDQSAALERAFDELYPEYLQQVGAATTIYISTTCSQQNDGNYDCQIVERWFQNTRPGGVGEDIAWNFVFALDPSGCWTPVGGSDLPAPEGSPQAGACIPD